MDVYDPDVRSRLFNSMEQSWRKLEPFRMLNTELIEEYAGSRYGYENIRPKFETLLNLMVQAVRAYTMELAANNPRVSVDTNNADLDYFAKHYTVAINQLLQEINIGEKVRKWVAAAFFSLGVIKVHVTDAGAVELWDGVIIDPGKPFCSNVAFDDFIFDMTATRWDQCKYEADCYRVPFEVLKDKNCFDQSVVDRLQPTTKMNFAGWFERAEMLSKGYQTENDDVEPMIDLIDVWIPSETKVFTFALDPTSRLPGAGTEPVTEFKWKGNAEGPYHKLAFIDVPENLMPSSPATHLMSLARLINNLLRKQSRQAKRQKDVHTYTPAGATDAKKIQRTNDGDWVEVASPGEVGVMKMGGADQGNQQFMMHNLELFDRMAGNLQGMLGLGQQADTLGQEQLIQGSQSKTVAEMRLVVQEGMTKLVRNLAFMLWHDPVKKIPGRLEIPGVAGMSIDATWSPEFRMGEFYEYDLSIDVFSMQYQPPAAKSAAINNFLQSIYIPMAQQFAQQGGSLNLQELVETQAELLSLPRLKRLIQFTAPPQQEGSGEEEGGAPPMTTRNYVRRNSGGGQPTTSPGFQMDQKFNAMAKAEQTNPDQALSMATASK